MLILRSEFLNLVKWLLIPNRSYLRPQRNWGKHSLTLATEYLGTDLVNNLIYHLFSQFSASKQLIKKKFLGKIFQHIKYPKTNFAK